MAFDLVAKRAALEILARTDFATREEARRTPGQYVDAFYNLRRRHSTVDYFSPIEFEMRSASLGEAASLSCLRKWRQLWRRAAHLHVGVGLGDAARGAAGAPGTRGDVAVGVLPELGEPAE